MSLCCFPFFRRSGQKKAQGKRCFCCCRNWCKRHCRHLLPSGRRHPQSSNKDSVEQLADRFTFALNGYKGQVRQDRKTVQCQTETSKEDIIEVVAHGPDYTTYQVRVQVNQADDTIQCLSESSNRHITEGLVNGFNYSTSLDPGKVHQATDTIQGQTQCAAERTGNLHESCRMHALQEGTSEKVAMAMVPAFLGGIIPHVSTLACSRAQRFLDELLTRIPFSISYNTGLVVMNSFSFFLSVKLFI
uniref:Uncharacterized protein n=1 Tax=Myotis myotis TaxID=51298 RepID=A0A7J7R005_MYOMY|nr:hypothetical protein mMyoMyo1_011247 [Myotis myotis]